MMGKKNRSGNGGLVYSTGPSPIDWSEDPTQSEPSGPREAAVRIEKSGRKGKTVTVIELRGVTEDEAKSIGKALKNSCGVGGTTKDTTVELQGDQRDRLKHSLESEGFRVKGL
jgi:translation initiation factor 1